MLYIHFSTSLEPHHRTLLNVIVPNCYIYTDCVKLSDKRFSTQ